MKIIQTIWNKKEKRFDVLVTVLLKEKTVKPKKEKLKWYPSIFTKKARILLDNARKNYWCTACWVKELLQVHHIDHDKFNNDDSNLLVLCFYCHAKEHKHMQNKKPAKWLK